MLHRGINLALQIQPSNAWTAVGPVVQHKDCRSVLCVNTSIPHLLTLASLCLTHILKMLLAIQLQLCSC